MTLASISIILALAPAASKSTPFNLSTTAIVAVVVVLVVGIVVIIGWRSPTSPHLDEKVEREKEE